MTLCSGRRHPCSLILVLAGMALVSPVLLAQAAASGPGDAPAIQVSYAGLDLSSPAGAEILYRRLKGAAEHVCGSVNSRQPSQSARWSVCYNKALSDAVAKLDQLQVTALYRATAAIVEALPARR